MCYYPTRSFELFGRMRRGKRGNMNDLWSKIEIVTQSSRRGCSCPLGGVVAIFSEKSVLLLYCDINKLLVVYSHPVFMNRSDATLTAMNASRLCYCHQSAISFCRWYFALLLRISYQHIQNVKLYWRIWFRCSKMPIVWWFIPSLYHETQSTS